MNRTKSWLFAILLAALYVLHQDFWFWSTARPLAFGFLPPGLWYHAGFALVTSLVMWLLVYAAWPSHLEETVRPDRAESGRAESGQEHAGS